MRHHRVCSWEQTKKNRFLFPHFLFAAPQLEEDPQPDGVMMVPAASVMMVPAASVFVGILVALVSPGHALYFHIGETEKKCFIEEIPDETMVIGELTC